MFGGSYKDALEQIKQYLHDSANLEVVDMKEHSGEQQRTSLSCELIRAPAPLTSTSTKKFEKTREQVKANFEDTGKIVIQTRSSFFDGGPLDDDTDSIYEGRQNLIRAGIEEIYVKNGLDSYVNVFIVSKNSHFVGGRKALTQEGGIAPLEMT